MPSCRAFRCCYGSTGEILTEKSGNLNLGIPGVMYVGGICGVIGAFFYEQSTPAAEHERASSPSASRCSARLSGSLLMGLLYCFLTVTLRANQNVTGLALTTFGVGIGNFFGGSLIKLTDSEVPSIALTRHERLLQQIPALCRRPGWFGQVFLSYGFLAYLAIVIASVRVVLPQAHPHGSSTCAPWARARRRRTPPAST